MGLSQQQIEVRATGLGGSDAAAAVGLSRWKSRYQLWLEKTGHAEPFTGNDATHWGNMLEPIVRQEYANRTGLSIITPGETLKHPDFPFVLANIDGIVPDDRIVECKTGRPSNDWGEPGTSEIPEEYVLQVQHYLMVTQLPRADVPVLLGGNDFRIYHIEADGETQALLLQGEREFWELVQRNEPPEPETPEDIRRRWPKSQDKPRIASGEIAAELQHLLIINRAHKENEERIERMKADIQKYLGECDTLVDERGRKLATWKTAKGATRFDAKAFEQAHPDLYREFCRPTEGSRRFLLKEIDE